MKKILFFLVLIFVIQSVFAVCDKGQIDINSASEEELVKINYVGEVRAAEIVMLRPFDSVGDLIEVYGIGEKTLAKIKDQGLACVEGEENAEADASVIGEDLVNKETKEYARGTVNEDNFKEIKTINLNTGKTIKSEDDKKYSGNYAVYGLIVFCVLLCVLFILRKIDFGGKDELE